MADFNTPINSTTYSDVLTIINSKIASVAKMDFDGDTNLATGFIRYNRSSRRIERWSGSAWEHDFLEPAGIIKAYAGTSAPAGHLLCDGSPVSRTAYAALFSAIGTTYGVGDNSTTFNLPNLQGRFPLGKATSGTGSSLGGTGGSLDHTHSVPAHYHGMGTGATLATNIGHTHGASSITVETTNSGHSHTHNLNTTYNGAHTHGVSVTIRQTTANATGNRIRASDASGTGDFENVTAAYAMSGGDHYHGINGTVGNNDGTHTHTGTAAGQTLATTNVAPSGLIGLVTGGANGNAQMTSGSANPPFLVLNYIITI